MPCRFGQDWRAHSLLPGVWTEAELGGGGPDSKDKEVGVARSPCHVCVTLVCTCVCVSCVYVCTYVCMCVMCVCVYICVYACVSCVYMCVCIVCVHV